MHVFRRIALYTALALGANSAAAEMAALEALREGDMKKLVFHAEPQAGSDVTFIDVGEDEVSLTDYRGKYILLNFWATWCAPCREEMPSLDALQDALGGDSFAVVTVATGRNSPAGIRRFFEETGVDSLPQYRDPKQKLARDMAVLGLPISVILNPEGQEIARLRGDAHWDSDSHHPGAYRAKLARRAAYWSLRSLIADRSETRWRSPSDERPLRNPHCRSRTPRAMICRDPTRPAYLQQEALPWPCASTTPSRTSSPNRARA